MPVGPKCMAPAVSQCIVPDLEAARRGLRTCRSVLPQKCCSAAAVWLRAIARH